MNEQLRRQRTHEAVAVTKALRRATHILSEAEHHAWLWADTVRECVEQRQGIDYDVDDPRILNDAEYEQALERCRQTANAVTRARHLLEEWTKAELS